MAPRLCASVAQTVAVKIIARGKAARATESEARDCEAADADEASKEDAKGAAALTCLVRDWRPGNRGEVDRFFLQLLQPEALR